MVRSVHNYSSKSLSSRGATLTREIPLQAGVANPYSDPFDEDEDWYKFDDDKVSIFPKDKIATLDGGGEDSSAYVLLYKSRPLE